MTDTDIPTSDDFPQPGNDRFQFGLRRILLLTIVCAFVASIAVRADFGVALNWFSLIVALLACAYLVLRLPHIARSVLRLSPSWKRHLRQRRELELFAAETARKLRAEKSGES